MAQKRKKIWRPETVIITVGGVEYEVRPQPLRRYLVFEEELKSIVDYFAESDAPKPDWMDEGASVLGVGFDILYRILNLVIPDLEREHLLDAPEPEIEHALKVCIDINGGKWAKALIENFFAPLMPALQSVLAQGILARAGETSAGETTSTS